MRSLAAVFVVGMLALPTLPRQDRSDGTWEAEFRAARMHLNLRIDRNHAQPAPMRSLPTSPFAARWKATASAVWMTAAC